MQNEEHRDLAPGEEQVASRAQLLPEEEAAGSANPQAQAAALLQESLERTEVPDAAPSAVLEHRTSAEATDPPAG